MVEVRRSESGGTTVTLHDKVRLYDTDASGLIFFGAASRWVTAAQSELFTALGREIGFGDGTATPVRRAEFDYLGALAQHDPIVIVTGIDHIGTTSFQIGCTISSGGVPKVAARMTHVCVRLSDMTPIPVPYYIVEACVDPGHPPTNPED